MKINKLVKSRSAQRFYNYNKMFKFEIYIVGNVDTFDKLAKHSFKNKAEYVSVNAYTEVHEFSILATKREINSLQKLTEYIAHMNLNNTTPTDFNILEIVHENQSMTM